jgi:hypothetical protein
MAQLTKSQTIRFTEKEAFYFAKLKSIGFNPNHFIRLAFREKINREYKNINNEFEKLNKIKLPF